MRVSRSLTIKQMAMVSAVTMLFVLLFCVILLFHSVQQNRYNTASQLESIARSVRGPLSASILKGDIPEAESILKRIQNQLPEEEKIQKSDFAVYNIDLQNTFKEVDPILTILSKA